MAPAKASVAMTQAAVGRLSDLISGGVGAYKVLPEAAPKWKNVELGAHPTPDERSLIHTGSTGTNVSTT